MILNARAILSGQDRSVKAAALRTITSLAEPCYATAMRLRNAMYHAGLLRQTKLPHPTISVGNLTTGGTGKTPVVIWLARELHRLGRHPAVLLRGYKVGPSTASDEEQLLQSLITPLPVQSNPSRIAAATDLLRAHPDTDTFLLDDAFQHRKVSRDFDLVLVNAADPFGFNHVLPRGLLREPLAALKRASAILLTRTDLASPADLSDIEQTIRHHTPAPIYRSVHSLFGTDQLRSRRFFAFAGIGDPDSFGRQLQPLGHLAGHRWFPDHHAYSPADIASIARHATGADLLVTTEKDWVKVASLASASPLPILPLRVEIAFPTGDDNRLLADIMRSIDRR